MFRSLVWTLVVAFVAMWHGMLAVSPSGAVEPADKLAAHLRGGEYVAAREIAAELPLDRRDAALGDIAQSQLSSGDRVGAGVTLRGIAHLDSRRRASQSPHEAPSAASGGAGLADFDSLMQLIQQTIRPDSWEALGGSGTMAPYPQGIIVDPRGLITEATSTVFNASPADMDFLLGPGLESTAVNFDAVPRPNDWRRPASLRVVSLRRLRDEIASRQLVAIPVDQALAYFAGLSEISHVAILENDILLAGPVGGIQSRHGWLVDARTGAHPLRLDFFAAAMYSAFSDIPFGCTIDPTPEGLMRAQQVATDVQKDRLPIAKAAEKLGAALGEQRVEVFGTNARTTLALLLVEADRHMKRIALGDAEMPDGVRNYLDFVDQTIEQGGPTNTLIRLWFTANPVQVQADAAREVFHLSGRPLRLSGQNERSLAQGRERAADDPSTVAMVDEFNRRFESIRAKYPIYGALESLYRIVACAELLDQYDRHQVGRHLLESIVDLESLVSTHAGVTAAPSSVDSIAIMHSVRSGRKRHHILLASGGVLVDTQRSLKENVETYPTLANVMSQVQRQPTVINRWWWNATDSSEYPASR